MSRKYIIGMTASRTDINGKKSLRRPKHSIIEVVEPEEEKEERLLVLSCTSVCLSSWLAG
jgi:hypothetical protein